ncbi:hypothetical protein [Photobacterium damselae]|uniref:hypothetical protein n=1 Tax=Photobacterium damselae TaxID=38293 RepID=UPI0040689D28
MKIKLNSISTTPNELHATLCITADLPRARELEQNLHLCCKDTLSSSPEWTAQVDLNDFPPQPSAEAACDKLSEWLICLGNSIKGKHVKDLNLDVVAKTIHITPSEK